MELKKNWNSNGNIARGDSRQLRGFCLGQTDSKTVHQILTCFMYRYTCSGACGYLLLYIRAVFLELPTGD